MSAAPDQNEARIAVLEAGYVELQGDLSELKSDIREMRNDLAGRPTWVVATFLGSLSSTCVGLAVALITTT